MVPVICIATTVEKRRPLRVDSLVPESIFTSTHAITIDAPPEPVWPWIAQMGAGRAGWYSWDAIDNGGAPSAATILPNLQTVVVGDVMPAVPGAADAFVVAAVDPPRDLVLTVPDRHGGNAVGWEHVLDPLPDGRTRLIVRGRASSQWLALLSATPPTDHQRFFIERAYCGAGDASTSAADRIRDVGPPHHGSAASARYSAPQHCGVCPTEQSEC